MRAKLLGIIVASLLIAGCGTTKVVTVLRTITQPGATATATATDGSKVGLPAASRQNQCFVSNGSAEIIFSSQARRVAPLCRAQAEETGWREGGQSTSSGSRELLVCYLRNTATTAVASVFDTATGKVGPRACSSLTASRGWISAQTRPAR